MYMYSHVVAIFYRKNTPSKKSTGVVGISELTTANSNDNHNGQQQWRTLTTMTYHLNKRSKIIKNAKIIQKWIFVSDLPFYLQVFFTKSIVFAVPDLATNKLENTSGENNSTMVICQMQCNEYRTNGRGIERERDEGWKRRRKEINNRHEMFWHNKSVPMLEQYSIHIMYCTIEIEVFRMFSIHMHFVHTQHNLFSPVLCWYM